MDAAFSSWFVILLAIVAANLPFFNERLFAVMPLTRGVKSFWWRLLELFVLYLTVGAIGMLLEARIGNAFSQAWGFYAVTGCLYIVLAFPGFAYRYLRKPHRPHLPAAPEVPEAPHLPQSSALAQVTEAPASPQPPQPPQSLQSPQATPATLSSHSPQPPQ